ncbi:MAG: hypothetical protein HY553_23130 [Elusimicrobia bacterium]|nr:hypothetical protein [Elusimicrobiota bacterium]
MNRLARGVLFAGFLSTAQLASGMRSTSAATDATVPAAPSSPLFSDAFDRSIDLNTWAVTSGQWRVAGGQATTESSVFRANTRSFGFKDVDVTFDLTESGLTVASGQSWHGIHMFLRRYSEYTTYYVSIHRRDGRAMIKKKVQGGPSPSNGGTYYDLASGRSPIVAGRRHRVVGRAVNNADGSVTVSLLVDGRLVLSAVDRGIGGAPLRQAGSTGVRGDYARFSIDDFSVVPTGAEPAGPGAPGSGGIPAEAKAPQRFLSPALADGINDAAEFGSDAEDVSIFDPSGRLVFRGQKGAAARVVWDCRDTSGRLVESGVYIAKIRRRDSTTVAQTFAVVK